MYQVWVWCWNAVDTVAFSEAGALSVPCGIMLYTSEVVWEDSGKDAQCL